MSYEISNWARPGHECRHNLLYWSQGDYRGFGCAAHSHRDGRRWWNVRTPERYIDAIAAGEPADRGVGGLDDDERRIEGLQLALRTRAGVPRRALPEELDGLVEPQGDRLVLTRARPPAGQRGRAATQLRGGNTNTCPGKMRSGSSRARSRSRFAVDERSPVRDDRPVIGVVPGGTERLVGDRPERVARGHGVASPVPHPASPRLPAV